jgi:hypothetical protein
VSTFQTLMYDSNDFLSLINKPSLIIRRNTAPRMQTPSMPMFTPPKTPYSPTINPYSIRWLMLRPSRRKPSRLRTGTFKTRNDRRKHWRSKKPNPTYCDSHYRKICTPFSDFKVPRPVLEKRPGSRKNGENRQSKRWKWQTKRDRPPKGSEMSFAGRIYTRTCS